MSRSTGFLCVAIAILLQSASAAMGKQAAIWSAGQGAAALVLNPWYVGSLMFLAVQAIVWMQALKTLPLSRAYPLMSLVLPANFLVSAWIFGEQAEWNHVVGIAILSFGAFMSSAAESA